MSLNPVIPADDAVREGVGLPVVFGNRYFVDKNGNGGDGSRMDAPLTDIEVAYAAVVSSNDDTIVLSTNSGHSLTEMLDVSNSRVHFVGDPWKRRYGSRTRITLGVTVAATDLGVMQNTGVGNTFSGIKFDSSNDVAESLYGVVEAGEYAMYDSCEFFKSTDLDVTGAAELAQNGDSAFFRNCTFGSNANAIVGAIVRPCVMLTAGLVSGKVSRDTTFEDCEFWRWAGNAANSFVWATGAADVQRKLEFKNCLFNATKESTGTPDVALGGAAALTAGEVLLTGTTAENGCTALANQTGFFSALATYAAGGGSGIQAT